MAVAFCELKPFADELRVGFEAIENGEASFLPLFAKAGVVLGSFQMNSLPA